MICDWRRRPVASAPLNAASHWSGVQEDWWQSGVFNGTSERDQSEKWRLRQKDPTTALGYKTHPSFISLPQSHAEKLKSSDGDLHQEAGAFHFINREKLKPLPLDKTETQRCHEGVVLSQGKANVCFHRRVTSKIRQRLRWHFGFVNSKKK